MLQSITESWEKKADQECFKYMILYPDREETIWFVKHIEGESADAVFNYTDNTLFNPR